MKNEGPNVFGRMPAVPKFLASLLLMLALSVTAAAQNRKISIDMQNVTVKEFFAEIEKRSDYTTDWRRLYGNREKEQRLKDRSGRVRCW